MQPAGHNRIYTTLTDTTADWLGHGAFTPCCGVTMCFAFSVRDVILTVMGVDFPIAFALPALLLAGAAAGFAGGLFGIGGGFVVVPCRP